VGRQRGMKKMLREVKSAGDEAFRSGKYDDAIRHYSFCITAASRGGFIKSSRVVVLLGDCQDTYVPKMRLFFKIKVPAYMSC
jgi:hypothetical protein